MKFLVMLMMVLADAASVTQAAPVSRMAEGEIVVGIAVGISTSVFAGLILWLIKGRIERMEADLREKTNVDLCKVLHTNLDKTLERILTSQDEIKASVQNAEKQVIELSAKFDAR